MTDYKINLNNFDKIIKFRSLNIDHNFIFLKIKNTIQVYDPIKLNILYSIYLSESITKFEISPKDSSVILSTAKSIQLYELNTKNLQDYDLKIKYNKKYENDIENIEEISISLLGDIYAIIDVFKNIKILKQDLTVLKTIIMKYEFLPPSVSLFPLEFFNLSYDTKNICLCRYEYNNLSLVHRNKNYTREENNEYVESVINFKTKILYLKEMQKDFNDYILYPDSSIYFMLGEYCNFLILRKIFDEEDIPNLIILSHIDLSTQTESYRFPSISFSLLYNNQNPIFNATCENGNNELRSYIVSTYRWDELKSKNSIDEPNSVFQVGTFYHKNISNDFLLFNFKENLILYKIEGLYSHPYNNLKVEVSNKIATDNYFSSEFLLLKMTKTLDRRFCVYFLDQNNMIRKFQFPHDSKNTIFDSSKLMKIYSNIVCSDHNEKNRKTLILEYQENKSVVIILNSKLEVTRVLEFEDLIIKNLSWVLESDFFIFTFDNKIAIINYISKYLDNVIKTLTVEDITKYHILKEFDDEIVEIKINPGNQVSHLTRSIRLTGYNDIKFELLNLFKDNIMILDLTIESGDGSLTDDHEYMVKMAIKSELLENKLYDKTTGTVRPVAFRDDNLYYFNTDYHKTNTMNIYRNKDIIFQTAAFTEILYSNILLNNNVIFITRNYINYFDISTNSFYRVKNNYIKDKNYKGCIDAFKLGIFTYISFTDVNGIGLVRVPRNKNYKEEFNFVFKYTQDIHPLRTKINIRNNTIVLNESQVLKLAEITKIKHGLKFNYDDKILLLLNSSKLVL
jgi:hypothetical protein